MDPESHDKADVGDVADENGRDVDEHENDGFGRCSDVFVPA